MASSKLNVEHVPTHLHTKSLGRRLVFLTDCYSTNDVARELARREAQHGLTIIAGVQRFGRGRFGRRWFSPKGGLWMTVLLRPTTTPQNLQALPLIGALSVSRALRHAMHVGAAAVRWPNDVVLGDLKVGGVLAESEFIGTRVAFCVLGIGLNANFAASELANIRNATTVREFVGRDVSIQRLVEAVLDELDREYTLFISNRTGDLLKLLRQMDRSRGRKVRVTTEDDVITGQFSNYEGLCAVSLLTPQRHSTVIDASRVAFVEYLPA